MPTMDELDWRDEIQGMVCPHCSGSLVWTINPEGDGMRAFCDWDGFVNPVKDEARLLEDEVE